MADLAIRFENASEVTFYKILAALTLMKGKGYIQKVGFEERKNKEKWAENTWFGEVQFFSREAMEIFGKKIRTKGRRF